MSEASVGNRAPLTGGGWRAAVLDDRASGPVLSSASERGRRRLQECDPRERSKPSDDARACGTGGLGVQRTRRTTWRISPTRLHSASAVASVALRLTDFSQLPQPATLVRQPRCRGTVVGETGCWCTYAHSVDICVEVREVASPDVPARQGKGTDNSRSLRRVSASRSDARRLRSHQ
jgi:hypothetical protein